MFCFAGRGALAADDPFSPFCASADLARAGDRGCARPDNGADAPAAPRSACRGWQTVRPGFRGVQWNRDKLIYDAILIAGVALFITGFVALASQWHPPKDYAAAID